MIHIVRLLIIIVLAITMTVPSSVLGSSNEPGGSLCHPDILSEQQDGMATNSSRSIRGVFSFDKLVVNDMTRPEEQTLLLLGFTNATLAGNTLLEERMVILGVAINASETNKPLIVVDIFTYPLEMLNTDEGSDNHKFSTLSFPVRELMLEANASAYQKNNMAILVSEVIRQVILVDCVERGLVLLQDKDIETLPIHIAPLDTDISLKEGVIEEVIINAGSNTMVINFATDSNGTELIAKLPRELIDSKNTEDVADKPFTLVPLYRGSDMDHETQQRLDYAELDATLGYRELKIPVPPGVTGIEIVGTQTISPFPAADSTLLSLIENSDESDTSAGNPSGCLIATAAFGSELSPQVQFLRNFRDNHILSTTAGSSFMNVFNSWYYSFSPSVADYEREQPWLQQTVKAAIHPLLGILGISEKAYFAAPGNSGALLAGLAASSMIGAVYFSPMALAFKQIRGKTFNYKLIIALGSVALALGLITMLSADATTLMISSAGFVLTILAIGMLVSARMIMATSRVLKKLSR